MYLNFLGGTKTFTDNSKWSLFESGLMNRFHCITMHTEQIRWRKKVNRHKYHLKHFLVFQGDEDINLVNVDYKFC